MCGRLKVEITRVLEDGMKEADAGSLSDSDNQDETNTAENEEQMGITDHDEEISIGQNIAVKVWKVKCNFRNSTSFILLIKKQRKPKCVTLENIHVNCNCFSHCYSFSSSPVFLSSR